MPSWRELKRFCERDGWELYKDTDHYFYRKIMEDGSLKRTKISKGKDILKKQLQVEEIYFNKTIST